MSLEQRFSSRRQRILGALLFGFLAEIINKICPLITLSIAQKRLGLGSLGSTLFCISVLEISFPLVIFGYTYFGALQIPKLAEDREAKARLISQIIVLRLVHGLITAVGLLLAAYMIESWHEHRGILLKLLPFLILTAFDLTFVNLGSQRMSKLSIAVATFKVLTLLAVLFSVHSPKDGDLFALIMMGANAGVSICSALWVLPALGLRRVTLQDCRALFFKASAYAPVVFLYPLFERFDILVVEKIQNIEALGLYTAPWRLVMSVVPIFMVIATTFLSENLAEESHGGVEKGAHQALFLSLALTFPIVAAAPLVAGDVLALVFDQSLRASAGLFSVFTASILTEVFVCILGLQVLLLRHDIKYLCFTLCFGIALGSMLAWGLQPTLGGMGGALGSLIGRIFTVMLILWRIPRIIRSLPWRDYLAIPVSSLLMVGCLLLLPLSWHVIVRVLTAGPVYLGCLAFFQRDKLQPFLAGLKRTGK